MVLHPARVPRPVPDLAAAAARFAQPPVSRFAPSPTGHLHLGHVVNAIYVWGVTRALGGRVLLRMEDHDRIRSRPAHEQSILTDLSWLGFEPDDTVLRQSARSAEYEQALAMLKARHHVYACACSRKDIGGGRYPGSCRRRNLAEGAGRGIRAVIPDAQEPFTDLLLGPQRQRPFADSGDLLLKDRDGHWTYQFAVTVDDLRQGVTLVIRGADLVSSTGRQLALARMLGRREAPVFLHHPLVLKPDGSKLSKATGDAGIGELRRAGWPAPDVIGLAAAAVGLLARPEPVPAGRVAHLFMPH
jgi:glutamyl-tRNA synthetase/glutamyl-Q tRNA(Asp) synthetase